MVQLSRSMPLDGTAVRVEDNGRDREIASVMGDVFDAMWQILKDNMMCLLCHPVRYNRRRACYVHHAILSYNIKQNDMAIMQSHHKKHKVIIYYGFSITPTHQRTHCVHIYWILSATVKECIPQ